MKTHNRFAPLGKLAVVTLALSGSFWLSGCCSPSHAVSSAGDTAASAVRGAGKTAASVTRSASKTAVSAVGTAGKVVHSSVNAAGAVAKTAVGAAADVATAPFVIFKDTKTGKTCRVPWREGLTLASAAREAGVNAELEAVKVPRGEDKFTPDRSLKLKPGDIIELTGKAGVPALVQAAAR